MDPEMKENGRDPCGPDSRVPARTAARAIYQRLASSGVRIFGLMIRGQSRHETWWLHDSRTVDEWRRDVAEARGRLFADPDGWADDQVFNAVHDALRSLGYVEVEDVVADVFEGRIACESARLVDDPEHEEQPNGFGHYGWETDKPRA